MLARQHSPRCRSCQHADGALDAALVLAHGQKTSPEEAKGTSAELEQLAAMPGGGYRLLELLSQSGWRISVERDKQIRVAAEGLLKLNPLAKAKRIQVTAKGPSVGDAALQLIRAVLMLLWGHEPSREAGPHPPGGRAPA